MVAVLASLFVLAISVDVSVAAPAPGKLWQVPSDRVGGSDPGQLDNPQGIATDPDSGHVYVADRRNLRVNEYDSFGQFVKAWGWGVADGATNALQVCTTICFKGREGSGPGQFKRLLGGIAVDDAGNIYVGDLENHRVQKFSPSGNFLLMFGKGVDTGPSHPGDLCTATFLAEGDTCGAGDIGEEEGQFKTEEFGNFIAARPGGLVVGDEGRIQEFNLGGEVQGQVSLKGELSGKAVQSLAVDGAGNFYIAIEAEDDARKVSPDGTLMSVLEASGPSALAIDEAGNLYVATSDGFSREVIQFAPDGEPVILSGAGFAREVGSVGGSEKGVALNGLATNTVTDTGGSDVYVSASDGLTVSTLSAFGVAPTKWPPPAVPPEIEVQYALTVAPTSATLGADINPRFWIDTTYYVEFGTRRCSEGGCPFKAPVPPASLGGQTVSVPVPTQPIQLAGLIPQTTYHYRFVAESSGGGPVFGEGKGGAEQAFTTPAPIAPSNQNCPNQSLRTDAGLRLADCRAYEMVSPVDKNNTDIVSLININSNLALLDQSSLSGEKLTYTTSQGFGDTQGAPYVSQYIASRSSDGWSSHGISPIQGISPVEIGQRIDLEFRAFTPDLCSAALLHYGGPALAAGAIPGASNLYLRANCGPEEFRTLKGGSAAEVQGLSLDGRCAVFYAPVNERPLYEACDDGEARLVSVLPNGEPNLAGSSAGTANGESIGIRTASSARAISADGSMVYWTASPAGIGTLYLRQNSDQAQSAIVAGKCTEPAKACTVKVANKDAHFWSASPDGSKAVYSVGPGSDAELFQFTLSPKGSSPIADEVLGVMGVSEDASRIAFVSREVLSTIANPQGAIPATDRPNLYLYDASEIGEERFRFVGILSEADAESNPGFNFSPVAAQPYKHTSRMTPDGRHLVFLSTAELTGFDSTDAVSGKADAQIFRYGLGDSEGQLSCVSCNPSGQRPVGRPLPIEGGPSSTWAAALVPPFQTELHGSRVISDDGKRLFFDSFEALVPHDTNGMTDVYQWEEVGSGDCGAETGSTLSAPNEGCLSLISTGQSESDSTLVDASPDGRDVFFTTDSGLVQQDSGLVDIYDARAGGGFPPIGGPTVPCLGEACQARAPVATKPGRGSTIPSARNPKNAKPNCGRGRHAAKKKGKWRCVNNKAKHKSKQGKNSKGAKMQAGESGEAGR